MLAGVDVRSLDDPLGRAAGVLLANTGKRDVIDAAVALLANDGDQIVTSDPDDIEALVTAAETDADVVAV